jgi:hypothetical protein
MNNLMNAPFLVLALSFLLMWIAAHVGAYLHKKRPAALSGEEREDFNAVLAATLTLLGLIIGFSFSMATSRYDQRKNLEEEEANAIGTEYVRLDLLPADDAAKLKPMLVSYLDLRIAFYRASYGPGLDKVNADTAKLQDQMWSAIRSAAAANPNYIVGLAVSGMNDVLNSQGYTQAAWWNRIPIAAWGLMEIIAIGSNFLFGFSARGTKSHLMLLILPVIVAVSFLLIADIDSPRGGIIRINPLNLVSLAESLRPH